MTSKFFFPVSAHFLRFVFKAFLLRASVSVPSVKSAWLWLKPPAFSTLRLACAKLRRTSATRWRRYATAGPALGLTPRCNVYTQLVQLAVHWVQCIAIFASLPYQWQFSNFYSEIPYCNSLFSVRSFRRPHRNYHDHHNRRCRICRRGMGPRKNW